MKDAQHEDGYPWTWEPAALTGILLLTIAILAVQIGRTTALLFTGAGLWWPTSEQLVTSCWAILRGNPTAGIPTHTAVGAPMWLVWTVTAAAASTMCATSGWALMRLRGRAIKGMATADQAHHLLGLRRLRLTRGIIRPDLYPKGRR